MSKKSSPSNKIWWVLLAAALLVGWGFVMAYYIKMPQTLTTPTPQVSVSSSPWWTIPPVLNPLKKKDGGMLCAQVITRATNKQTGEVRDFPTPCDVPEGWEMLP